MSLYYSSSSVHNYYRLLMWLLTWHDGDMFSSNCYTLISLIIRLFDPVFGNKWPRRGRVRRKDSDRRQRLLLRLFLWPWSCCDGIGDWASSAQLIVLRPTRVDSEEEIEAYPCACLAGEWWWSSSPQQQVDPSERPEPRSSKRDQKKSSPARIQMGV